MRQSATKRGIRGRRRKPIDHATRYFMNNRHAINHDAYIAAGLPIGSGVVEGACRHLVKDRMERSGMQWTIAGYPSGVAISSDLAARWGSSIGPRRLELFSDSHSG